MKTAIIKTGFWLDDDVFELNSDTRLLYLCLLTNPNRDTTPAFKVSDRMLSAYTGYSRDLIEICRKQLVNANKIVYVDGYYIFNEQDFVKPAKGRDSNLIYERAWNELPENIKDVISNMHQLSSGTSSGTPSRVKGIGIEKGKDKGISKEKVVDEVAKAYYDLVKKLELPVRNHNNLKTRIKSLEKEIGKEKALLYLDFVSTHYQEIDDNGYKPRLMEALDIYAKRIHIQTWMDRLKRNYEEKKARVF